MQMILLIFDMDFQPKFSRFGDMFDGYETFCFNLIFLLVKKIFETPQTQKCFRYLPQRDQEIPGGI